MEVDDPESTRRSLTARVALVLLSAVGLGAVVVAPIAGASCAGPQLVIDQGGYRVPGRQVGKGPNERIVYHVSRDEPLQVLGTSLTHDCNDTASYRQVGCGPPIPDPVEPERPFQDAQLVLAQQGRVWTLGRFGDVGPDLEAIVEVDLPADARPGPAVLQLREDRQDVSGRLELALT